METRKNCHILPIKTQFVLRVECTLPSAQRQRKPGEWTGLDDMMVMAMALHEESGIIVYTLATGRSFKINTSCR